MDSEHSPFLSGTSSFRTFGASKASKRGLDLSRRGLKAWPSELFNLRQLESLDLSTSAFRSIFRAAKAQPWAPVVTSKGAQMQAYIVGAKSCSLEVPGGPALEAGVRRAEVRCPCGRLERPHDLAPAPETLLDYVDLSVAR